MLAEGRFDSFVSHEYADIIRAWDFFAREKYHDALELLVNMVNDDSSPLSIEDMMLLIRLLWKDKQFKKADFYIDSLVSQLSRLSPSSIFLLIVFKKKLQQEKAAKKIYEYGRKKFPWHNKLQTSLQ